MTLPLVCLHGWCCEAWHFDPQVEYFSSSRHIISIPWQHRLEQRGGVIDLDVAARDIEVACREAELPGPPVLIGHSMGGLLAAMVAAAGRLPLSGIVIIDASYPLRPAQAGAYAAMVRTLEQDFLAAATEFFSTRLCIPEDDSAMTDRVVAGLARADASVAIKLFGDITVEGRMPPIEQITVPILGIGSARPFLSSDDLLSQADRAWYGQVVASGHMVMLQAPDQLNAMLDRFITICEDERDH